MVSERNPDPIRSSTDLDPEEALVAAALTAADARHGRIAVLLLPSGLFAMLAEVQLALAHPDHPVHAATVAEMIGRDWQRALTQHVPEVAAILEAGWERSRDVRFMPVSRPRRPGLKGRVLADGTLEIENLDESLDLDQWPHTEGRGHIGGPQCPHCGQDLLQTECDLTGHGSCGVCEGQFRWVAGPGPAGFAWTTWALDRAEEERGERHGA